MKKLVLIGLVIVGLLSFSFAEAKTYVRGYTTSRGTYVMSHYRTSSNYTRFDNWSTKGNYNPYTGKKGYVNPYKLKF